MDEYVHGSRRQVMEAEVQFVQQRSMSSLTRETIIAHIRKRHRNNPSSTPRDIDAFMAEQIVAEQIETGSAAPHAHVPPPPPLAQAQVLAPQLSPPPPLLLDPNPPQQSFSPLDPIVLAAWLNQPVWPLVLPPLPDVGGEAEGVAITSHVPPPSGPYSLGSDPPRTGADTRLGIRDKE